MLRVPSSKKEVEDDYKGTWTYRLVHDSGDAELTFYDWKCLPRMNFSGAKAHIGAAVETINFLIQ